MCVRALSLVIDCYYNIRKKKETIIIFHAMSKYNGVYYFRIFGVNYRDQCLLLLYFEENKIFYRESVFYDY